ncbi:hypothetical protein C8J56DRAFT_796857 [Mycena floridula]|nr:hypothetical protein C8J56DRAFT_796857 [Mycena floridula]
MSLNDCAAPTLPNPFTPLAFVLPDLARQIEIGRYVVIGGLSESFPLIGCSQILIWDILSNVTSDYRLLFKSRRGFATVIYFLSRILTLAYVLAFTILRTLPVGNCSLFDKLGRWGYGLSVTSTSLLFFFRVKAVYSNRRSVAIGFFCLWLVLVGCTMTVVFGVSSGNIGSTAYCIDTSVKAYVSAAGWGAVVYDTSVTLAISLRLLHNSYGHPELHDLHTRTQLIFSGKYLPRLSRTIFQDGQLYYWITVGANFLLTTMIYVPHVPPIYRAMFTAPTLSLTNIMACYVFRHTKLVMIREGDLSGIQSITPIQFPTRDQGMIPLTNVNLNSSSGNGSKATAQEEGVAMRPKVERFNWESESNKAETQLIV